MARFHSTACGVLLLISPVLAVGQDRNSIGGPVLGIAADAGGAMRPIHGIPGAAILGSPIDIGPAAASAAASSGAFILASSNDTGQVLLFGLRGEARAIDGSGTRPDRILLSPSATAAVLYHRATTLVEIVTGLPEAPAISGSVSLSSLPGTPDLLAVSDDGSAVLAAARGEEGGALFLLGASGELRSLVPAAGIVAASFLPRSLDAVAADAADPRVLLIRNASGPGEVALLAGPDQGISSPVGVAASNDGRRIFVANGNGKIAAVNADGSGLRLADCACRPAGLFQMNRDSLFRLNEISSGPLWLFDGGGEGQQVFFVPPDPPAGDGGNAQ